MVCRGEDGGIVLENQDIVKEGRNVVAAVRDIGLGPKDDLEQNKQQGRERGFFVRRCQVDKQPHVLGDLSSTGL